MAITDKLTQEWNEQEQGRLVFEVRSAIAEAYEMLQTTKARIDAIAADSKFDTVDPEIKQVAVALRANINDAEAAMGDTQDKRDFLLYVHLDNQ